MTKNIALSDLGQDGNIYELFPIIINLTEIQSQCGEISVDTVKLAVEDQLAESGKVVPLIILDKKGNPIQDMPHTRGLGFWGSQKVFRALDISVFKVWKPEVWNVIINGIPNACSDDDNDDTTIVAPETILKSFSSKNDNYEDLLKRLEKLEKNCIQTPSNTKSRIENTNLIEKKKIAEVFSCTICLANLKFPAVVDKQCKRIIGCRACIEKLEDSVCPLCRAPLDDDNVELNIPGLESLLDKEDSDHEFDLPAY